MYSYRTRCWVSFHRFRCGHLLLGEKRMIEPLFEASGDARLCTRTVHVAGFRFIVFAVVIYMLLGINLLLG